MASTACYPTGIKWDSCNGCVLTYANPKEWWFVFWFPRKPQETRGFKTDTPKRTFRFPLNPPGFEGVLVKKMGRSAGGPPLPEVMAQALQAHSSGLRAMGRWAHGTRRPPAAKKNARNRKVRTVNSFGMGKQGWTLDIDGHYWTTFLRAFPINIYAQVGWRFLCAVPLKPRRDSLLQETTCTKGPATGC